jgi:subfamily B ATP-binding cassette protein MsbA
VQYTVSSTPAQVLSQSITLMGGVVLLVLISPVRCLTVLTFLPVVIIAGAMFGRRLRAVSAEFQDRIAEAAGMNHPARNARLSAMAPAPSNTPIATPTPRSRAAVPSP